MIEKRKNFIGILMIGLVLLGLVMTTRGSSMTMEDIMEEEEELLNFGSGTGDCVVVGTVSGTLYCIEQETGQINWQLQTGEPLVNYKVKSKRESEFQVIPSLGVNTNLYSIDPVTKKLNQLPLNIRNLVEHSPFQVGDTAYIGSKKTRIFAIRPKTGQVVSIYSSTAEETSCPSLSEDIDDLLLISRADYYVRAIDLNTGIERWNLSSGEFIYSLPEIFGNGKAPIEEQKLLPFELKTDNDGSVVYIDAGTNAQKWKFTPDSRVISGYSTAVGAPLLSDVLSKRNRNSGAVSVLVEQLHNGPLYAIENPSFVSQPSLPLMLPSSEDDLEPSKGNQIAIRENCDSNQDLGLCFLIGLHSIYTSNQSSPFDVIVDSNNSSQPVVADTPEPSSNIWLYLLVIVLSIALIGTGVTLFVWKQKSQVSVRTPTKPAKKKKKEKVKTEPEDTTRLVRGKLTVFTDKILGYGSCGTIVYEGQYEGRKVAVKRMLAAFYKIAQREVTALLESDTHNNIITYYAKEEDKEFIYLVLTYCATTLSDLVEGPDAETVLTPDLTQSILKGMVTGVLHLHKMNIVHTDLKPQNILLDAKNVVKISDMGLAKILEVNQSSFSDNGSGSFGWQAPEVVLRKSALEENAKPDEKLRITKQVDVWSLGCLMYYVLTKSGHPFGNKLEREVNVLKGKWDLSEIEHDPLAYDLIRSMISADPALRPTMAEVAIHPYFWTPAHRLLFLKDASDRLDIEKASSPIVAAVEANAVDVVTDDWSTLVDNRILENLGKYRKYNYHYVRDILRLIRNKSHHYLELPEEVRQTVVGPPPGPFLAYFDERFPKLLLHTYRAMKLVCRTEPTFENYFQPQHSM